MKGKVTSAECHKRRRDLMKARGLCVRCGKPLNDERSKTLCREHLDYQREYMRGYDHGRTAISVRREVQQKTKEVARRKNMSMAALIAMLIDQEAKRLDDE